MTVQCKYCNKDFSSYASRSNHIKKFHNDDKKKEEYKGIIKCDKCIFTCNTIDKLKNHNEKDCRPSVNSNNVYKFKAETFGKNKYKGNQGGDIYIIQTEFNLKDYYKIGITTNLYNRMGDYRCGSVLEPKLHYYYPCKQIKEADKLMKGKLVKYNIKREIYKIENLEEIRNIIKTIQTEMNSEQLEISPEMKECDIINCDYCQLHFTNKIDLIHHRFEKHGIIHNNSNQSSKNNYKCRYCDKIYKHKQTRYTHELKCKTINNLSDNTDLIYKYKELKKNFEELVKEINEIKKEHEELKLINNGLYNSRDKIIHKKELEM